jgi:hypothetical protein
MVSFTADSFLTALMPLGQWLGERRIRIDGPVSVLLRDGLAAASRLFELWYERYQAIAIESREGFAARMPRSAPRAASFLSGGIDSLALLRANRLAYSPDHPRYIHDGLLLFGLNTFDRDATGFRAERIAAYEAHLERMTAFARRNGITLIPVRTNVRALYPDFDAWAHIGAAAGIISPALCLGARFDRVELGSAGHGPYPPPRGTHPALDHHFSTEAVTVRQAQIALTRFEKTRIVAEWDDALTVLRTCLYHRVPDTGRVNCGECEKCLRTMLFLEALGKLDGAITYPCNEFTPSMLEPLAIENHVQALYYTQCVDSLAARGRHDLVRPLRRRIDSYERRVTRRGPWAAVRRILGS